MIGSQVAFCFWMSFPGSSRIYIALYHVPFQWAQVLQRNLCFCWSCENFRLHSYSHRNCSWNHPHPQTITTIINIINVVPLIILITAYDSVTCTSIKHCSLKPNWLSVILYSSGSHDVAQIDKKVHASMVPAVSIPNKPIFLSSLSEKIAPKKPHWTTFQSFSHGVLIHKPENNTSAFQSSSLGKVQLPIFPIWLRKDWLHLGVMRKHQ